MSFSAAVLLLSRQLAMWTVEGNRLLYHWQRSDAAAFVLVTAVTTVLLAGIARSRWLRDHPKQGRVARIAFVVVLADIALGHLIALMPECQGLLSILVMVGIVWSLIAAQDRAVAVTTLVVLLLSPLGLILLTQAAMWRPYDIAETPSGTSSRTGAATAPPIALIIFDDWSYERTKLAQRFGSALPNLTAAERTSYSFTQAFAPAGETSQSIPRLLFQSNGYMVDEGNELWWVSGGQRTPTSRTPNIFTRAAESGYRTSIYGYYLPFREMLGGTVDVVRSAPHVPKSRGLIGKAWWIAVGNVEFLGDPLSRSIGRRLTRIRYNRNWQTLNRQLEQEVTAALSRIGPGTLTLAHFPLPHSPFVFDASGRYRGDSVTVRMEADSARYLDHVRYMDVVLGRVWQSLRASGMLDSSLVIITSDHSWRMEPNPAFRLDEKAGRHVPLIVKWPKQAIGAELDGEFCLLGLGELLGWAQEGRVRDAVPGRAAMDSLARLSCAN